MKDHGWGAGGILIIAGIVAIGILWIPEQMRIDDQAEAAKLRCAAAQDTQVCLDGVEKWAAPCYRKSFLHGSSRAVLSAPPITSEAIGLYDHCLRHGPDSVLEERMRIGAEQRKREKKREDQLKVRP